MQLNVMKDIYLNGMNNDFAAILLLFLVMHLLQRYCNYVAVINFLRFVSFFPGSETSKQGDLRISG